MFNGHRINCFARWLLALACGLVGSAAPAQETFQYRPAVNLRLINPDPVGFNLYTEGRIANDPSGDGWHLSPRLVYNATDHLSFELHYRFQQSGLDPEPPDYEEWQDQHRVAVEVNPRFPLGTNLTLRVRNRYEHRWIEDSPSDNRTRHRFELLWNTPNWGRVTSIYMMNEIFYDWDSLEFSQNRFFPLGVDVRLSRHLTWRTMYFWEYRFNGSFAGESRHVLNTILDVRLD
jgi:hypothetical protein